MASGRRNVKNDLAQYLDQTGLARVTEEGWRAIRAEFVSASEGYLRRLLRASGLPLDPLVEGVRQDTLEELERTLRALELVYYEARSARDAERTRDCRRLVIEAKDHARWASRRAQDEEKRRLKEEMIGWMLVWLEDPGSFPTWVTLRKRKLGEAGGG